MGVARDNTRSAEDVISTPLPGETLAMFYSRSRMSLPLSIMPICMLTHFQGNTGPRKLMRRVIAEGNNSVGMDLCLLRSDMVRMIDVLFDLITRLTRRFFAAEYKPILKEVEKILTEAGLDEEEMRKGAAAGPGAGGGQSRNRR